MRLLATAQRGPSWSAPPGAAFTVADARQQYALWMTSWVHGPLIRLVPFLQNAPALSVTGTPPPDPFVAPGTAVDALEAVQAYFADIPETPGAYFDLLRSLATQVDDALAQAHAVRAAGTPSDAAHSAPLGADGTVSSSVQESR